MSYKDRYVLSSMFSIIILFVSSEMYSGFDGSMDGVFFNQLKSMVGLIFVILAGIVAVIFKSIYLKIGSLLASFQSLSFCSLTINKSILLCLAFISAPL
ncbi:Uncharacterised protein [Yersinia enterocolitica]|nr:putative membrane protein [Yersinia enterocolitica]VTP77831.1 Uncharacterised protein [Yersinia enterocolitica subsp. enterocolitica]AJJ22282.1 putative membrane protein [Yersinia enterocolitica]KGA70728.1 putative membrane protein [Yersinia enterocolitica]KGA76900.1 putative membrane protein [Yersinia enterocolitica]